MRKEKEMSQIQNIRFILSEVKKEWRLYLLLIPMIIFFLLWNYKPMFGLLIAFKDFNPALGVFSSEWVGFLHFQRLMFGPDSLEFWRAFRNTFLISFYGLLFGFPIPIILAILFSEIKNPIYRSITQIITYLPKFISTVVITSIIILGSKTGGEAGNPGFIASIIYGLGIADYGVSILRNPDYFRGIYLISGIWEGAGYSSIVYFAAIMGVSVSNYEAARIDGANKLAQIRYVTLPGISSTLSIMLILRIGKMLTIGFEKVLLLYDPTTYSKADVISTFVFRLMQSNSNSLGAAADMFNAFIAMALVLGANFIMKKVSETSLF